MSFDRIGLINSRVLSYIDCPWAPESFNNGELYSKWSHSVAWSCY